MHKLWLKVGKKFLYVVVTIALSTVRNAFPDVPLPNEEMLFSLCLALVGAHTATDITSIIRNKQPEKQHESL